MPRLPTIHFMSMKRAGSLHSAQFMSHSLPAGLTYEGTRSKHFRPPMLPLMKPVDVISHFWSVCSLHGCMTSFVPFAAFLRESHGWPSTVMHSYCRISSLPTFLMKPSGMTVQSPGTSRLLSSQALMASFEPTAVPGCPTTSRHLPKRTFRRKPPGSCFHHIIVRSVPTAAQGPIIIVGRFSRPSSGLKCAQRPLRVSLSAPSAASSQDTPSPALHSASTMSSLPCGPWVRWMSTHSPLRVLTSWPLAFSSNFWSVKGHALRASLSLTHNLLPLLIRKRSGVTVHKRFASAELQVCCVRVAPLIEPAMHF
mmetsp:Transcript_91117/g.283903  ORF Transcript_91117/g.283903 Transcript_91117/m.283903 type:complete len:310 (-) Transcript_91117:652-1581(-)